MLQPAAILVELLVVCAAAWWTIAPADVWGQTELTSANWFSAEVHENENSDGALDLYRPVDQYVLPSRSANFGMLPASWNFESKDIKPDGSDAPGEKKPEKPKEKTWFEKYSLRGYAQFRFNEVLREDPFGAPAQSVGDRSIGDGKSYFIRRARIILAADITENLYVYLQPDFAVAPPGSPDGTNFVQIRDWYGDIYLTTDKVHRLRAGSSKVPFGFENLQSSSNRLPLDRSDSLNSAVRNERDLGMFYYFTPAPVQDFFKSILDDGLKGSGNYGLFGIGTYAGQGGSLQEANDRLHVVSRLTLPYTLASGQRMEMGVQGYFGDFVVLSSPITPLGVGPAVRPLGALETGNSRGIYEDRIAASFIWYPQPWGFQTEWNVGRGPALNPDHTEIVRRHLKGGYMLVQYQHKTCDHGIISPFYRYTFYEGGYKNERNAPFVTISEHDFGVEWQFGKGVELTVSYLITDRTNTQAISVADELSYRQFDGDVLRFQLQLNY
ncbi:MAG TPA: porin [Pirellulaceae bacterium]|nr:porin [Pirellulaceae bacterium]